MQLLTFCLNEAIRPSSAAHVLVELGAKTFCDEEQSLAHAVYHDRALDITYRCHEALWAWAVPRREGTE